MVSKLNLIHLKHLLIHLPLAANADIKNKQLKKVGWFQTHCQASDWVWGPEELGIMPINITGRLFFIFELNLLHLWCLRMPINITDTVRQDLLHIWSQLASSLMQSANLLIRIPALGSALLGFTNASPFMYGHIFQRLRVSDYELLWNLTSSKNVFMMISNDDSTSEGHTEACKKKDVQINNSQKQISLRCEPSKSTFYPVSTWNWCTHLM